LKTDKKNEKHSAEIEAKLSDKFEKQIQKAVKEAAVEIEVTLTKIGDDLKSVTKDDENIKKAQHEMTMEKQIEQLTNAFVQDKQWSDILVGDKLRIKLIIKYQESLLTL